MYKLYICKIRILLDLTTKKLAALQFGEIISLRVILIFTYLHTHENSVKNHTIIAHKVNETLSIA